MEDEQGCTEDGRLPAPDKGAEHLKDIFYRMGFSDKEIVVLSGAHTIGQAFEDRSGYSGSWTKNDLVFDNSYFKELKNSSDGNLLRLPSDELLVCLVEFRSWVEKYANDQELFFKDYTQAHVRLSELG